ncbi:MAG: hypothetical protein ABI665_18860 [Vicinamibacterales bacterium]
MKKQTRTLIVLTALAAAAPAWAQEPAPKPMDAAALRHHIYVMEGALARAVDYGAKTLNQQIRTVMPDVFMLAGEAQARGVYLEGYGVFFDVEVPMLRQSMMWSLRMMLDQDDSQTQAAITAIRKHLQGISDPATRAPLEASLKLLERQAAPGGASARTTGGRDPVVTPGIVMPNNAMETMAPPRVAVAPGSDKAWMADPNRAYTDAVQRALVDAMLDFGGPLQIGPDQWLTVAARDNERRDTLAPQDPFEEVVTMLYRIKGSDLTAYRSGKIDQEEARRRVKIGEF